MLVMTFIKPQEAHISKEYVKEEVKVQVTETLFYIQFQGLCLLLLWMNMNISELGKFWGDE